MSGAAEQVRCPSCGGGQPVQASDRYECQFCLTAFTFRHARDEEARVLEEIKAWVEQRVGGQAAGGGDGIDASSRAYLFRKNLLPALQTAYDRALEATLGFEQHPLLPPVTGNGAARAGNPLLERREEVLGLRDLRARLESPEVRTFAVTDDDRTRIAALDGRLQEIVALSNTAHAAAQGTAQGFAAARHNLESVLAEGGLHPGVADRYRALVRLARLMEQACGTRALSGAALAPEADQVAAELAGTAQRLETDPDGTVGTSLAAVAAREEARHAGELARWLRSYDALVARTDFPFLAFVQDTLEILGHPSTRGDGGEVVEACARAFRAVRGEEPVFARESFRWVPETASAARKGRVFAMLGLGFLGLTEEVAETEEFFVPFWLVRGGGTTWLADATGAADPPVLPLRGEWSDLEGALASPVPLRQPRSLSAPAVTAAEARRRVATALEAEGRHNADLSDPALAMLPAARIRLRTGKGAERVETSCLEGRVRLGEGALHRLAAARRLQERFQ